MSDFFQERDIVFQLLEDPGNPQHANQLNKIFEKYQEQPHLLDVHLDAIVAPLIRFARGQLDMHVESSNSAPEWECCLTVLYTLCKCRGPKVVVRFVPKESSDLVPLLNCLESDIPFRWEARYVLLLWLSVVAQIPIALPTHTASNGNEETTQSSPYLDRLIALSHRHLADSGITRQGAATLLVRLLTRPETSASSITNFFTFAKETLFGEQDPTRVHAFLIYGVLEVLSGLFKHANRDTLLPHLDAIMVPLLQWGGCDEAQQGNPEESEQRKALTALHRKLLTKCLGRIGLLMLPPRVAPWRYERGSRSLSLSSPSSAPVPSHTTSSASLPVSAPSPSAQEPQRLRDTGSSHLQGGWVEISRCPSMHVEPGQRVCLRREQLMGQMLRVRGLEGCTVYAPAQIATLTVTNLRDCHLIIGPAAYEIKISKCERCTFVVAGMQVRITDTSHCTISLHAGSPLSMDGDCTALKILPYAFDYPERHADFEAARLRPAQNHWNDVQDFRNPIVPEWTAVPENERTTWSLPADQE